MFAEADNNMMHPDPNLSSAMTDQTEDEYGLRNSSASAVGTGMYGRMSCEEPLCTADSG
ncbi:hypothetical protein F2Q69_00016736 [Brassica cretica]|uniref:Uncharacterized protein n=1 Tax=Brassica cretica TaxID=69181 RepID=A0A8S9R5K9_BRACR|nr:hypothetical protein F2Q69_00016736 [Brassica cretica]